MTSYFSDYALVGGQVAADVLIDVDGERITAVSVGASRPDGSEHLRGFTIPAFANAHSHTFHRALRGHTHRNGGTFWTWREDMYRVAASLTPDSYYELAKATYTEMVMAGISSVGEFHYVHHQPDGRPYDDPNAMGLALVEAARDAGIRITLLDTCYLTGGIGQPLEGPQLRFGDGSAGAWAERVDLLADQLDPSFARLGAAIHSVRAVPPEDAAFVAAWAASRDAPLHFHLSEQRAENEACLAAHGRTPTQVLSDAGALGPRSTAVHATHLTPGDIDLLSSSGTTICMTPTTERDLADGIGPARTLALAGCPITLGSDSNAFIDMLDEARSLEMNERLRTEIRGHWSAVELLHAASGAGHRSLAWPNAGRIEPNYHAGLVMISLDSVRLAGWKPETLAEAAAFVAATADLLVGPH